LYPDAGQENHAENHQAENKQIHIRSFYAKYMHPRRGLYWNEMGPRTTYPRLYDMRPGFLSVFVAGAILLIALVCVFFVANRPQLITNEADIPENFPVSGFAHDTFEN